MEKLSGHVKPFIVTTPKTKALHFSLAEVQSRMSLRDPLELSLEYTRLMMGFLLFNTQPGAIGLIGLGGGSVAKFCHHYLPRADITAVEINPHVVALRNEFAVPADGARFRVLQADGADFVRGTGARFDALLVDGFSPSGLPPQLCSEVFYTDCRAALAPEGILVLNLYPAAQGYAECLESVRGVFGESVVTVTGNDCSNSIVFAAKGQAMARLAVASPRRPDGMPPPAWSQLTAAFMRVSSAMRSQLGWLPAAPGRF
jgi:spermidine synthase